MHGHYNGFEPYANIMCIFGGLDPLCETTRVPWTNLIQAENKRFGNNQKNS